MPECLMEQGAAAAAAAADNQRGGGGGSPVRLEPFSHQVGGHSCMLRFDDTTVCKPLIAREHNFYESMPDEMKEFTPQYRGVTQVRFVEDRDGYLTLLAYPPKALAAAAAAADTDGSSSPGGAGGQSDSDSENSYSSTPHAPSAANQRFRLRRSGSVEMESPQQHQQQQQQPGTHNNPWSLRCHKMQLAKMKKNSKGRYAHKFLLLENLASRLQQPCILDLKMGTRQHGDDASEEKRQLQRQKCMESTSASLGARICGMQSYQVTSGQYTCRDKYYGRSLSVEGMRATLYQFLHNGVRLRRELLAPIRARLLKLRQVLSTHHTFRFYSSSLLIMYDGADWTVSPSGAPGPSSCASPSADDSHVHNDDSSDCSMMLGDESDSRDSASIPDEWVNGYGHEPPEPGSSGVDSHVDVRMIDFAHVTHQGFRGDRILHQGPDHGYLFGLDNLVRMFEDIERQAEEEEEGVAGCSLDK